MRTVAPPGRTAVRLVAMTHKVHPFHRTNAMAKVPPTHRVAALAMETGSPTVAVSTSPAASGTPRATGGQIRNAGESTLTWCPDGRPSDRCGRSRNSATDQLRRGLGRGDPRSASRREPARRASVDARRLVTCRPGPLTPPGVAVAGWGSAPRDG